jgi:hypothetical protein
MANEYCSSSRARPMERRSSSVNRDRLGRKVSASWKASCKSCRSAALR